MADWSLPRKPRKSNFSTDEVDVLVDSVKAHYNVLYGKYAKRATNRWIRQKAWMDILKKVNGVSIEKRTLQEVKNKWKKCQYALKEKVSRRALADEPDENSGDEGARKRIPRLRTPEPETDSMPLQERLSKVAAQEKIAAGTSGPLKSQPLSPTKLKVTRQGTKVAKHVEHPPSPVNEEMCLRWNSHHSNMQTAFPNILSKEQYVDVTLAAEGKTLKCHRLILSSCSPYFDEVLSGISPFQHPVLFMRDIPFWILQSLCDFMYAGEVHIFQDKLEELLTVAEALKIKGLAGKSTPPENQEERPKKHENSNHDNKEKKKVQQEKEKTPQSAPVKKNPAQPQGKNYESTSHDYDDDLLDPLDLLEPLYEEATEEKKSAIPTVKPKENKFQYQPIKKPFTRRLRKRKLSEQREPSPPPVFSFRKGTRSRPNVKIPKYYHTDFTNPAKTASNSQTDPLLEVDEIKTEPIDVEDNMIVYSDEDHYMENSLESANCDSPIIITSTKPSPLPQADKFKKIKLTKPVITEVHSIDETNTTAGGLEVIKITLPQSEECNGKNDTKETQDASKVEASAVVEKAEVEEESQEKSVVEKELSPVSEEATEKSVPSKEVIEEVTPPNGEIIEEAPPKLEVMEEVPPQLEDVNAEEHLQKDVIPLNEETPSTEEVSLAEVEAPLEVPCDEEAPPAGVTEETDDGNNILEDAVEVIEQETGIEEIANLESEIMPEIRIEDVRSASVDENEEDDVTATSLDHLEKEAMNVANAITMENQAGPPDIE